MNTQSALQAATFSSAMAQDLVSFEACLSAASLSGQGHLIRIEAVQALHHRVAANELLSERYRWRGYGAVSLPVATAAHCLPLTASRDGKVIGTLTVNFDSERGLNCDDTFPDEVMALRTGGERLCEFTKLAVDTGADSAQVLAALFHVAFLAARNLQQVDTLLLEVNPRHVRYYQRMLGARSLAAERLNRRVNAPAVLLAIATADVRRWIDGNAAMPLASDEAANDAAAEADAVAVGAARAQAVRTLYGLAFNRTEEAAILGRLARQWPPSEHFVFRLPAAGQGGLLPN